jgi:thiol-disulfide isomerase/thioredoxin
MFTLHRTHWNMLLLAVLLLGGWLIVATRVQSEPPIVQSPAAAPANAAPAPLPNHPAPDFTLVDLTGAPVQLSELRGQVVLVNVWATWCPPCRAEMPMLQAAYAQYREQGFTVLAVNQREDAATIGAYMQAGGYSFPALLDSDGAVSGLYQALVLPSSYFIDRAGVVRAVYKGPLARSVIAGTVEQLLAEAP